MKKSLSIISVFLVVLVLVACAPVTSTTSDLGADKVAASETTQAVSLSSKLDTWRAKLEWQASWLWSSYTSLKTKVDATTPAMVALCKDAWEMVSSLKGGHLEQAYQYYINAKADITKVTEGIKK